MDTIGDRGCPDVMTMISGGKLSNRRASGLLVASSYLVEDGKHGFCDVVHVVAFYQ